MTAKPESPEAREDASARALGVSVRSVLGDVVTCTIHNQPVETTLAKLRAAAEHEAPIHTHAHQMTREAYRSLLRQAIAMSAPTA